MRKPNRRELSLIALALVTIILAVGADREGGGNVESIAPPRAKARVRSDGESVAQAQPLDITQLQRSASGEPGNPFESKSWYVPPPPPPPPKPAPPPPPPVPTAPPLPFIFLGQYQDSDKPVILLLKQDRIYTVKVGDVIDGTYRVEGIVGTTLGLTYLPLKIKQIINIGQAG